MINNRDKFLKLVSSHSSQEWVNEFEHRVIDSAYFDIIVRISLKLRHYMKENKMSQKDLAEKLNVSPQYINKILRAKSSNFTIETAVNYGKILGIRLIDVPIDDNKTSKITFLDESIKNVLDFVTEPVCTEVKSKLSEASKSKSYKVNHVCY